MGKQNKNRWVKNKNSITDWDFWLHLWMSGLLTRVFPGWDEKSTYICLSFGGVCEPKCSRVVGHVPYVGRVYGSICWDEKSARLLWDFTLEQRHQQQLSWAFSNEEHQYPGAAVYSSSSSVLLDLTGKLMYACVKRRHSSSTMYEDWGSFHLCKLPQAVWAVWARSQLSRLCAPCFSHSQYHPAMGAWTQLPFQPPTGTALFACFACSVS